MSNIQTINFNNQKLLTVEKDGIKYVAVKPICENLGLDWDSQRTKIKNNHILNEGAVIITFPSEGGLQQTTCLPIDMINGWLFTINPNKVSEEIRPVVLYYQKECYKALFEFWNKSKEQESPKPVEPPPSPGSAEDKIRAIKFVIDEMKLSTVAKQCLLLKTAETVTGVPIPYRPAIERKTYSAKEIGEMLGVSGNKIGRIANSHNLKIDKYGQFYLSKSESSDKQVETFRSHEGRSAFMLLDFEEIIPVIKAILEED